MSIFVDSSTRIVVQGITGGEGSFWTKHMLEMGADVVAGVTPGKEGQSVEGLPVFHSVARAVRYAESGGGARATLGADATLGTDSVTGAGLRPAGADAALGTAGAPRPDSAPAASFGAGSPIDAAMLFVPPRFTKDAVFEALDAGIKKIVTIADGIPLHDQVQIRAAARAEGAQLVGGNTSGVISPGKSMLGIFPYWITRVYKPGRIGVMTRSGSLTNEVTAMVVRAGFGVSTLIGVGGDPVPGCRFAEFLPAYEADPETEAVVIIGELGGTMEEEVAEAKRSGVFTKPVVAFIGGRTAPEGKKMGHAGAIVTGGTGAVKDKVAALKAAGALVADRPSKVGDLLAQALGAAV